MFQDWSPSSLSHTPISQISRPSMTLQNWNICSLHSDLFYCNGSMIQKGWSDRACSNTSSEERRSYVLKQPFKGEKTALLLCENEFLDDPCLPRAQHFHMAERLETAETFHGQENKHKDMCRDKAGSWDPASFFPCLTRLWMRIAWLLWTSGWDVHTML